MDPVTAVANLLSKVVGLISQCMQLPGSTIGAKVEELKKAMKDLQAVKGNGVKKSERWQGEVDAVENDVKKILEEYDQRCCRSFCCCWSCSSASLTGKVNEALETVRRLKIEGGSGNDPQGKADDHARKPKIEINGTVAGGRITQVNNQNTNHGTGGHINQTFHL